MLILRSGGTLHMYRANCELVSLLYPAAVQISLHCPFKGTVSPEKILRGYTRHTSTALYFYGASKKSLHKPRAIYENMLFHISYGFNYYISTTFMFKVSI
jgi:hypothetical protein